VQSRAESSLTMPEPTPAPQPIIIKKKIVHGGHHGGAWKVAYADFVTAMMALFIVLWLMNTKAEVQKAVGGYFRDPTGKSDKVGSGAGAVGLGLKAQKQNLEDLKKRMEEALKHAPFFAKLKNQIEMTVTHEGFRLELAEAENGTFFESGNATPTPAGEQVLALIAGELKTLPNSILTEGHTDSRPFGPGAAYTNWELSADRANAARRVLQKNGLPPERVAAVRGYADKNLRRVNDPTNAANRRVSIIVEWIEGAEAPMFRSDKAAAPQHSARLTTQSQ
jgi:chemotaxis protein MotB